MFEILVNRGATRDYQGRLAEADGTGVVLAADDFIRVKIGRGDQATPDLDILSGTATSNSSSVTIDDRGSTTVGAGAQYTLRLAQGDTVNLTEPVYEGEVAVVDNSETAPTDAFIQVEKFVLHVIGMQAGNKGVT